MWPKGQRKYEVLRLICWRGFFFGFKWQWHDGGSSKTSAVIASYHHPKSITWRWAMIWSKSRVFRRPGGSTRFKVLFLGAAPFLGALTIRWQDNLFRKAEGR